jgi:hypothetical protein
LASALLVVGCQNYDDQFSALETQINALASTVAGLSQVQSDLSSLAGTVNSLASTVNGLGSQIDTAVSDGLADIQADIDAIETAVADVASSEEVSSLSDAVAESQTDLDQLLANSSVFNNSIVINSEATADLYAAMGTAINIVNGDVTIEVSTDMTQATVQTVVDNILNIVGNLTYEATASTVAETTFNNLSGVGSITAKQGGGYEFKALKSATAVVLNNDYKSTVDIIHFGALTTVSSIADDGGVAGTIAFDKAAEFHLTSLTRYPGNNLNIEIDKGGVLAMGALTDNDATGLKAVGSTYALTVKGPAALDISKITDGTITVEDVASLTVSNFIGKLDVNSGVETLNGTGIVEIDLVGGVDLDTVTISGALDSDAALTTADTAGPAIAFTSVHTDLTTASLSGVLGAISAVSAANLESLTVSADLNGSSLTATGNNDLTTVNVNGAKVGDVTIQNNTDLETLILDHTSDFATGDTGATISITGNTNMTSLTFSADDVDSLTVTGNTQLTTLDFTGLADLGTSTTATVAISGNKLVATTSKDAYDATTTTDTGAYTTSSGMGTLTTYLTAAMAATGARTIGVYFDTVETAQSQASAAAAYADDTHTDAVTGTGVNAVAYAVTTGATGTDVSQSISYVFRAKVNVLYGYPALGSGEGVTMTLVQGPAQVSTQHVKDAANTTVDLLIAAISADTSLGSNISLTAARDSYAESYNLISYTDATGAAENTATADANNGKTVLWSLGSVTGTAVLGSNSTTAQIATAVAAAMTGTVVDGVGYGAVRSGNAIVLNRVVSNTTNVDLGKNTSAFPTIAFDLGNATFTTVDFATGVNTNSTGAGSDFNLSVTGTDVNGLRVTIKNNSTAVALSVTSITTVGTAGAFDAAGTAAAATLLASGTNMAHDHTVVSAFADISSATAASTATKNRISWL